MISELRVVADHLLPAPEQVIEHPEKTPWDEYKTSENHVYAVIHAKINVDMQDFENKLFI